MKTPGRLLVSVRLLVLFSAFGLLATSRLAPAQSQTVKALVGGTLIDGFGSKPIRNSVIIIEGERIKAVGQVGSLAIPKGAEVISTDGLRYIDLLQNVGMVIKHGTRYNAISRV